MQYFYSHFRTHIWTANGFRDAFNLSAQWYDTDELGIDQGPIVIMIENYRTQSVWRLFMQNPEIQRGLQLAGFVPLPFMALNIQALPAQNAFTLTWDAPPAALIKSNTRQTSMPGSPHPNGEVNRHSFNRKLDRQHPS